MNMPAEVLAKLRCPEPDCGAPLEEDAQTLRCTGGEEHVIGVDEAFHFLTFAPKLEPGKYKESYAQRYAFLWAFGYQTRQSGWNESLYRTVSSLVAESLADLRCEQEGASFFIVDAGCGVGRIAADCAKLAPGSTVLGLDGSYTMLNLARTIVCGDGPVRSTGLNEFGFEPMTIEALAKRNAFFAQADVENLPLNDACADLVLSVNIIDRLPEGPEKAMRECYRVLRPGGWLIFTDPLNWNPLPVDEEDKDKRAEAERDASKRSVRFWKAYGEAECVRCFMRGCGFRIETWFDDLLYHEILDARGSLEMFRTMVVKAQKRI